jgi:hypothetical protein
MWSCSSQSRRPAPPQRLKEERLVDEPANAHSALSGIAVRSSWRLRLPGGMIKLAASSQCQSGSAFFGPDGDGRRLWISFLPFIYLFEKHI